MSEKEALYELLKQTFILLDDGDRRLFGRFNLSPTRYYALLHISNTPGLSSSELSDRLLCDKSNATRIVKGLESSGYLVKRPHETDGRTLRLFLTQDGKEICETVTTRHEQYNDIRLDCIDDISRGSLLENLEKLNELLQQELLQSSTSVNGTKS